MLTPREKKAFASRLRTALESKNKQPFPAAKLALQFNLRHPNEPITSQAAHKWLSGTAVPSPDKAETLAQWLEVDAHWLRFGTPAENKIFPRTTLPTTDGLVPSAEEGRLLNGYRSLNKRQRKLVQSLIEELLPHED